MVYVERTFQERLQLLVGSDRGWTSRAVAMLDIPTTTLARYIRLANAGGAKAVPEKVWARLASLEQRQPSTMPDRTQEMVRCFAKGLVAVQADLDRQGFIRSPYPEDLSRAFNVASACRVLGQANSDQFPIDLEELVRQAQRPLFEWLPGLSGVPYCDYLGARLLHGAEVTRECLDLANLDEGDAEKQFFDFLMQQCQAFPEDQGQQLYVAWRKAVIEHPVADSYSVFLQEPVLSTHIAETLELVQFFYEPVSAALVEEGRLPLCPATGTRLRRISGRWISESRDSDVHARLAAEGPCYLPYSPQVIELKRPVRTFWCHPGRYELELAKRAAMGGWNTALWPNFDAVDLLLWKDSSRPRFAVDVKDHLSPSRLARLFEGFKGFRRHQRLIVIPDYLGDAQPRYSETFEHARKSAGKDLPRLERMSDFIAELENLA